MEKKDNSNFYPILISLERFPCLVVGGGKVACRKVLSLLEFNAEITVISPKFCKQLLDMYQRGLIQIIRKSYSKEFIKNYKIIFSTTDNPETNRIIRNDCNSEGILLNAADNPALCDFILPANIKRGDLTISISSQGKAPFFTKEMKKKLEQYITPVYADIMELAGEYRKKLLKEGKIKSVKTKTNMFRKFTSINWEKTLVPSRHRGQSSRYYIQKILNDFNLK